MSDMHRIVEALGNQARNDRSRYHLTLGQAIEQLEKVEPSLPVLWNGSALGDLQSYRGYYSDLAFAPTGNLLSAGDVLHECRGALGHTFRGYKGGDFVMGSDTPLWVSAWGDNSGIAVMGFDVGDDAVRLVTKDVSL